MSGNLPTVALRHGSLGSPAHHPSSPSSAMLCDPCCGSHDLELLELSPFVETLWKALWLGTSYPASMGRKDPPSCDSGVHLQLICSHPLQRHWRAFEDPEPRQALVWMFLTYYMPTGVGDSVTGELRPLCPGRTLPVFFASLAGISFSPSQEHLTGL